MLTLLLLSEGDCHGYDLTQRLRDRSDGFLTVQEGSLYPILRRLSAEGYISATETFVKTKNGNTRIRIVYHLEEKGWAHLRELMEIHRVFSEGIRRLAQNEMHQEEP